MNKIYRTVYNETTGTWVAVEETAKSHRKSNGGVVDNTTTSVSGSLKGKTLTAIATSLALLSPFMAETAQADVLCKVTNETLAGHPVGTLFAKATACGSGETLVSTVTPPNGTNNSISIGKQNGTFNRSGLGSGNNVITPGNIISNDTNLKKETPGAWGNNDIAIGTNAAAHGERKSKNGVNFTAPYDPNDPNQTPYLFDVSGYYDATGGSGRAIAIGQESQAVRSGAIAVGWKAMAGENAIAIGNDITRAVTPNSIAIGYKADIHGQSGLNTALDDPSQGGNSIAFGSGASNYTNANSIDWYANTRNSIAIGKQAHTHAANAFAIGVSTDAVAERAFAIGTAYTDNKDDELVSHQGSLAAGQGSIVIGDQARSFSTDRASSTYSYDHETQANTGVNDSVAIGTGSLVSARNALALGGGISYTYHDITDTNGSQVMKNISKYYFGDTRTWEGKIEEGKSIGAKVGSGADGAIALGGASADITGADNDYFPKTEAEDLKVTNYVKAAEVAKNAKRSIALGGGTLVDENSIGSVAIGGEGTTTETQSKVGKNASNAFATIGGKVANYATNAIAMGKNAQAQQKESVAIGSKTVADGVGAVAIGGSEPMDNNNNILDGGAKAIGVGAVAIGQFAEAQKTQGVAVGDGAKAQGSQSTAIGANSIASGAAGIAIGGDDIGRRNANGTLNNSDWENTHTQLQALQTELTNNGYTASTVINNVVTAGSTNAFADITTAQGDVSMALGQKALAQGHLSNAVGALSKTVGNNSIAFGTAAQSGAKDSIAMGAVATTGNSAKQSTAIGYMAQTGGSLNVTDLSKVGITNDKYSVNGTDYTLVLTGLSGNGENSVAVGERNKVLGNNSTAVGQGNIVLANNAGAFGDPNVVTADATGSYAIGNNNVIGSANAYALGSNITATAKNSVFLGDSAAYVQAGTLTADNAGSTAGTTTYSSNLKDIKNTAGKTVIDSGSLQFAGAGSADNGVVSVGAENKERRIQNVAAGLIDAKSTDAINGSQLYLALQNLDTSINTDNRNVGLATIDGTQTIVSPYLDMSGLNGEEIQKATAEKAQYEIDLAAWKKANQSATPEQIAAKQQELLSATTYLQHFAQSTGQHAVAIGYGSKAQGDNSVAFMGNTAQGTNAMVWGENANAGLGGDYVNSISTYQDGQYGPTHTVVDWTSYVRNGIRYYKLTYDDNTTAEKTLAQLQQNAVFTMKDSAESGKNATAFGQGTIATGQNATAFGLRTIAGNFTDANGNPVTINATDNNYQVIAEDGTVIATATNLRTLLENHKVVDVSNGNNQDNQVAWGEKTFASGKNATAFGFKTRSTAEDSTAWGHKTSATNNRATAFGIDTEASGRNSTAFGNITHATNENATAWGSNTQATGIGSTAWGSYTVAGGDNSTAWGNKSEVGSGSFAIQKMDQNGDPMVDPNGNPVNDNYTNLSIQFDSTNEMYYVQAVDEQGKTVTLAGDKSKYPNALIEPQNEDWTRPAGADEQEVRLRVKNWIANNGGTNAGDYSTAFGNGSKVYAENALGALGGIVNTDATNSAAIGNNATVNSQDSYAIGADTVVNESADNSFATTGGVVSANATNAIALGGNVEKQSAVAIGKGSNAKHQDSVALGSGSQTIDGVQARTGTVNNVVYGGKWAGVLTDINKVVSVGGRQIQNVAAGQVTSNSTDAINGSQLYQAYEQLQWRISAAKTGGDINEAIDSEVVGKYTGSKNGGNVKFIAGDGVKITTKRDTTTDGSLNLEFSMNTTTVSNETNGSLKLDDIDKGNSPATAASVVNAVNNSYWVATDGTKTTEVKPSNQVQWKGSDGVEVVLNDNTKTFDISLDQPTKDKIDSKLSTLKTRVSKDAGSTHSDAQTLNATQTNADFIQGDNIELTAANNGITIATAKDVKFNSVETKNLTATGETKLGNKFTVANDGTVTYSNSNPTNANEVVNKTYADNLGWDLQVNGTKQGDTITNGKAVNFANGSNTTMKYEGGAVKVDVNTTMLTATDGKVDNLAAGEEGKLTTAQNVADMINQTYWIAQDGNDTGTVGEQISAGDNVVFQSADGSVTVKRTTNSFDFKVNKGADPSISTTDGTVSGGVADTYWDSKQVENAINQSGWIITSSTAGSDEQLVQAGGKVDLKAGSGVKIEQSGKNFTFSVDNSTLNAGGNKPLKFKGDNTDVLEPDFGDTVNVVGGAALTNLTDGNIGVVGSGKTLTVKLNKDVDLGDSGSLKVAKTTINQADGVTTNALRAGDSNVFQVSGNSVTYNRTIPFSETNGNTVVNKTYVDSGRTVVVVGKNVPLVTPVTDTATGQTTYTVDAIDTQVAAGSGLKMVSSQDPNAGNDYVRQYELGLSDENQGKIDNALSSLKTRVVKGGTPTDAQSLDKTQSNADFIQGDNIELTAASTGITIATAKDVKFDSVETTDLTVTGDTVLQGNTTIAGNTTITGDTTYTGAITDNNHIVNKGYADGLGWNIAGDDKAVKGKVVNGNQVNFVNGKGTQSTVTYSGSTAEVKYDVNIADKDAGGNQYVTVAYDAGSNTYQIDDSAITTALGNTGFTLKTKKSDGEVSNTGLESGDEINNGESVTLDAGKNIALTQTTGGNVSIATKDDVTFNSVTATTIDGGTVTATTLNAGNKFNVNGDSVTYDVDNTYYQTTAGNTTVVNKGYADSLGWDLQVNGTKQGDTITNGKAVNFANGDNTTVKYDGGAVKVDVNTTTLTATDGKVDNLATGEENKLTTAQNVANMINQTYWIAQDGNDTGTAGEQISAGDNVVFQSADGSVTVKRTTNSFDFKVNKGADPSISTTNGTVSGGVADTYWDSKQVENAINQSGWIITSSTAGSNEQLVQAGGKVDLKAGSGVKIEQSGKDFTFSVDNSTLNAGGNKPLEFIGDTGETVSPNFGETVKVVGEEANVANLTSGNIGVVGKASDNSLTIKLNKDIDLSDSGSLKMGDTTINNGGVTVNGGSQPVTITKNGLDNGGNTITNVAEGVNNTDAVNVEQLNKGLAKATTEVKAGNNIKSVDKTADATDGHDIYTVNAVGVKEAGTGNKYVKVTGGGTDDFVIDDSAIESAIGDASFSLTSSNQGANTGVTEEIKKGGTVTINGGSDNVAISQTGGTITVDVAKDVKFDSVETGTLKVTGDTQLGDNFKVIGGKVTYNQTPTDDNEVVNKKYADNLGWDLQVNGTKQGDTITNGKAVNFANGDNTTVKFEDNAVKVNVNTTTLTATDGKVNNPATGGNNLTTAQNVADMINQSYWIAQDGNGKQTQVKAGDTVSWQGQGSLKVENSNGTFTISDNTTYTSTVTGLTLDKKGDTVELGGDLTQFVNDTVKPLKFKGDSGDTIEPKHGDTVEIVGDNNISVVGKDGKLNVQLNPNVDLGDLGSLKTGDTTVNNDGITINNGSQGKPVTLTKDGLNNGGNKITHVAAGVDDTDAVNVGQLKQVTNIVTGGKDSVDIVTYNVQDRGEHHNQSVIEAIDNINAQGIQFFHTNQTGVTLRVDQTNDQDSSAAGAYATAIGVKANASEENTLAMGHGATASAVNAIAIGNGAQATGEKSISIGAGNIVSGARSGAIGDPNVITGSDSWALGNENIISTNNTHVVGNNVKTTADNSVFLGNNTAYTAAGASTAGTGEYAANHEDIKDVNGNVVIATGELKFAGSHTDTGVVSVGDVGNERRIQNVAPGKLSAESTDAINGSQLYSVAQKIGQVSSGGAGIVQYSNPDDPTTPNGGTATNDVTLVGADKAAPVTIHNVAAGRAPTDAVNVGQLNQAVGNIHNRIDGVSKHADASAASAIAVASMPQAFLPGKNLVAIGGGTYHGQTGYAIGFSTISDNGHWIVKGTATGNSKNRYGAGVGAGYQW